MVQLKVQSPLVAGKCVVKRWGPSLSDCLEIQASFQKGLAVKGTWKCVSTRRCSRFSRLCSIL